MSDFLAAVLGRADGRPVLERRPRALFEPLPRSAAAALAVARHTPPSSGPPSNEPAALEGRRGADQDADAVNAAAADVDAVPATEFRGRADVPGRPERMDRHAVAAAPNLTESAETAALASRTESVRTRLSPPVHLRADAADPAAGARRDREDLERRPREGASGGLRPAQRLTPATAAASIRPAFEARDAARPHTAPRPGAAMPSAAAQAAAARTESASATTTTTTSAAASTPAALRDSHAPAALRARAQRSGASVPPACVPVPAAAAPPPAVQFSIGRIDVRALVTSPPAAAARPASGAAPVPALSLDAYLRRRHGGGGGRGGGGQGAVR